MLEINSQLEKRILASENMSLRRILNKSWQQKITNAEIRRKTGHPPVIEVLETRRWTYLGHALCKEESHLPRTTYEWKPDGRRKQGRRKNTLRRTYDRDQKTYSTSLLPEW